MTYLGTRPPTVDEWENADRTFVKFTLWSNIGATADLPVKYFDVFIISMVSVEAVAVYKVFKQIMSVGILLSAAAIFLVSTVCCFALISHIDDLWNASVPALILAKSISPLLALVFALIIFAGIYTSAVPLLWTGVKKVSFGKERNYKIATVAGGIIGCVVACFVPYKGLINVLYGLNGYLGFHTFEKCPHPTK